MVADGALTIKHVSSVLAGVCNSRILNSADASTTTRRVNVTFASGAIKIIWPRRTEDLAWFSLRPLPDRNHLRPSRLSSIQECLLYVATVSDADICSSRTARHQVSVPCSLRVATMQLKTGLLAVSEAPLNAVARPAYVTPSRACRDSPFLLCTHMLLRKRIGGR